MIFAAYLLFINAAAFALMGADKRRAEQNEAHTRAHALLVAALFGGLGASRGHVFFQTQDKALVF